RTPRHRHDPVDPGSERRADGYHDAGDGRLRDHAGDPEESEVPAAPDSGAYGEGDEGRPREVPAGGRGRLHPQARQHRSAPVVIEGVAVSMNRPKILIVDDQPRNLDVLEAMLDGLECAFVRASSADEALLALVRHDFAALVLDIRMPGMSGIDLAQLIKQRKRSRHVPILFLTAHSVNDEDVLRGYGVGAVDYLSKPINPDILRSKIGVFVELHRATRVILELNDALQREVIARETVQAALEAANRDLER